MVPFWVLFEQETDFVLFWEEQFRGNGNLVAVFGIHLGSELKGKLRGIYAYIFTYNKYMYTHIIAFTYNKYTYIITPT